MLLTWASQPTFNPASVSALKYWMDAGAITGKSDGDALATTDVVDRSASALGALQARLNLTYRANAGNGKPALEFNGTDSYARTPSFTITQPHTVFAVIRLPSWASGKRIWDGNTVNRSLLQTSGVTPTMGIYAGTATTPTDNITDIGYVTMIEASYNGASSTIRSNGNNTTTGNPGSLGFNDGAIFGAAGGLNAGFFWPGRILEWMVCDSTLTAAQKTALRAYLTVKHSLITRSLILCDGNSLTRGFNLTAPESYPSQLLALMGGAAYIQDTYINRGVDGQTTADMLVDAATEIDAKRSKWADAAVVCWEQTNDIGAAGATGVTAYDNIVTYCTDRRTAGFKVVVMTCIARGDAGWTGTMETHRTTSNQSIRDNWATFADGIVDLALDSRFTNPLNTTYFQADKIHLTAAGYAVVAALVKAKIDEVFA